MADIRILTVIVFGCLPLFAGMFRKYAPNWAHDERHGKKTRSYRDICYRIASFLAVQSWKK